MVLYRLSQKSSAKFRAVIHWLILSETCCINIGRNLDIYVII
jgi:hypothetical protein